MCLCLGPVDGFEASEVNTRLMSTWKELQYGNRRVKKVVSKKLLRVECYIKTQSCNSVAPTIVKPIRLDVCCLVKFQIHMHQCSSGISLLVVPKYRT